MRHNKRHEALPVGQHKDEHRTDNLIAREKDKEVFYPSCADFSHRGLPGAHDHLLHSALPFVEGLHEVADKPHLLFAQYDVEHELKEQEPRVILPNLIPLDLHGVAAADAHPSSAALGALFQHLTCLTCFICVCLWFGVYVRVRACYYHGHSSISCMWYLPSLCFRLSLPFSLSLLLSSIPLFPPASAIWLILCFLLFSSSSYQYSHLYFYLNLFDDLCLRAFRFLNPVARPIFLQGIP